MSPDRPEWRPPFQIAIEVAGQFDAHRPGTTYPTMGTKLPFLSLLRQEWTFPLAKQRECVVLPRFPRGQLDACISFSELQRLTHSWRLPRSTSSNFTKQIQYDIGEKRRRALLSMNVSI
jgi:hypothetical protein